MALETLTNLELTRFLFALLLLLVSAHSFGFLFHRFKLPRVIGEIVGGIVLGPSLLLYLFPPAYSWIFEAFSAEGKLLSAIYWLGLVMLMFISGFEIQKSFRKSELKLISYLLIGATLIPFIAGWLAPRFFDFSPYIGPANNPLALNFVIAIAVAVTSIPVISKIFIDLGVIQTRFAKIVLSTSTIQDILLWIALAIATGLVGSETVSLKEIISITAITIAFFLIALIIMPHIVKKGVTARSNLIVKSSPLAYALVICFFFATLASFLNVNIIFGAFLAGIIVGTLPQEQFGETRENIKKTSLAFFIPIYFAIVGLKIDLIHHLDITFLLGFLLFSAALEMVGTYIAARLAKRDHLTSFNFGVAMNTRGGPGIVLATVAFEAGIINETFFVTLVLIAIITSLIAGWWFKYLLSKNKPLMKE